MFKVGVTNIEAVRTDSNEMLYVLLSHIYFNYKNGVWL